MKGEEFYSSDPMDYVRVALSIETLAYYDKNYLSYNLQDNSKISEQIQALLVEAIRQSDFGTKEVLDERSTD
jgi:hypothetical protein